jgi:divinyl protochlorophyllide a 8-vinyl-reductase
MPQQRHRHAAAGSVPGRIGPNAIIRLGEALEEAVGQAETAAIFSACGLSGYLATPPDQMVSEDEVARLHAAVFRALGTDAARSVSRVAGARTGDYLLAHRIPHGVQRLLKPLPARLASPLLTSAIRRHAWTFVGSGAFCATSGRDLRLSLRDCPICRELTADAPVCDYFAATFERLYRVLVHPEAEVREEECEASGGTACVFVVRWR